MSDEFERVNEGGATVKEEEVRHGVKGFLLGMGRSHIFFFVFLNLVP